MEKTRGQEIAKTIFNQIGGKALFMLGAKNKAYGESENGSTYVSFRVRGSKAVNYVKITLNGLDLYDMEFGKIWGTNYKVVKESNNIYFDFMHKEIESATGLYTSL